MKRFILVAFAVTSALTLGACSGYDTDSYVQDGDFKVVGDIGNYDVLRDMNTGCQYLESHSSSGLTPYYDKDGNVKGCSKEESE